MPAKKPIQSSHIRRAIALKRAELREGQNAHITAEERSLTPLLPANLTNPSQFRSQWQCDTIQERFAAARRLADKNDWVGSLLTIKFNYFSDGFRFADLSKKVDAWRTKVEATGFDFVKFADDVWWEWLIADSVLVFWKVPQKKTVLPTPIVLDGEICSFDDTFGARKLEVKPGVKLLTEAQKRQLGPRWAKAWSEGKPVVLDESEGEFFQVLTRAKTGKGLSDPRVVQVFESLATYELLRVADYSGAWEHKDLVQHILKGHEIRQGPNAGDPRHFITKKQQQAILKAFKVLSGGRRVVTNFDVQILWQYLNPNFFDEKKHAGTIAKLENWGGAASQILKMGTPSPYLMDVFKAEGSKNRQMVSSFIGRVLNHPDFNDNLPPPEPVAVGWNEQSFLNTKMMLEWIRTGYSNGLISPQTARAALGVEDTTESANMKAAKKNADGYTPIFEPKQGLLQGDGKGGRPSNKPTAQTPGPKDD